MTETPDSISTAALEDVAYLSRSENRVRILCSLARGPHTRRELGEVTSVSRATLGRITNELEERGWAERTTDGDYVATPTGIQIASQFVPFVKSVETIRRLGETVTWLPTEELSIGLHHFNDATVRRPKNDDLTEAIDYFTEKIRDVSEFSTLTELAPPVSFEETMHEDLLSNRLTATYVLTGELVDYLRDQPERRERWRDCLEAGVEAHRYEGDLPCNLFVFDETVLIKRSGSETEQPSYGIPIETSNPDVRSWAHDLIESYRTKADPITPATF